jgi:hypothetical protein
MSSQGTGSPITQEEANDLLHKLITESTKVQAVFVSGSGVTATVPGRLKSRPEGNFAVFEREEPGTPMFIFNPSFATSRRYGDNRAFSNPPPNASPRFTSALIFILPDGSQVALFAIAEGGR